MLKGLLARIRRLFSGRVSSEDILSELRSKGACIGEDVHVYAPNHVCIDKTAPFLIKIGNHVRITEGVTILTHDYAWSVLKDYQPEGRMAGAILGAQSPVEIGDHVFIGMNTIITRGVKIGDRVIIGAGSVVTKDCAPCSVYAGNPARRICSLEEYYWKRMELQFQEARRFALCYKERLNKVPPIEAFDEYFMLFATRDEAERIPEFRRKMELMSSYEQTAAYMEAYRPRFDGYEAFLRACFEDEGEDSAT